MQLLRYAPVASNASTRSTGGRALEETYAVGVTLPQDWTEGEMAENTSGPGGHPDMDYAEHEWTYALFLRGAKWLIAIVVVILLFLAYMWG